MNSIERKNFGYKLTFGDNIRADEMRKWVDDSKTALADAPTEFGVFVDMRTLKPLAAQAQEHMQEGQKLYKDKGMVRSVVIVDSAITKMQFVRIAKETGIYQWERYVDASAISDWEKVGLEWIEEGKDPD